MPRAGCVAPGLHLAASVKTQIVVITGASAGVGRATAQAFARRGAKLGLIARSREALEDTQREVERLGGEAMVLPLDVADAEAVERAAAAVEQRFGPIDIWVNNAMVSVFGRVDQATPEEIKRVTEVTYLGTVYGTLSALRRMRVRRQGKIIQVGSALAYRGIPLQAPYCGAKHAIQGFTESMRCELMHDEVPVDVTIVEMPALNTPQFDWVKSRLEGRAQPVPPIFQPEVAARAIVWAAHHRRRELFVGFPTVKTIWGNKVAPWFADRVLAKQGIDAQQVAEPEDPERPNNLWQPVRGLHRAHGRFDDRSRGGSLQLWLTMRRAALVSSLLGVVALLVLLLLVWRI